MNDRTIKYPTPTLFNPLQYHDILPYSCLLSGDFIQLQKLMWGLQ
ncbi:hypothetical protein E2C01_009735 [Portunus trituberculatus]|uniref:Uncharacterized protein n=1 Tax=Portunus trituberculatus TaxID=210409 RepID=A0A5B7D6S6_PORTR|nr:hypothetical protein [Portunus trituberculatus]